MADLVGPALAAAVVSALVTGAGWLVSHRQERGLEARRRTEKVRDFATALVAEIRSNLDRHANVDLDNHRADIQNRIAADPSYTPFIPRYVAIIIFDKIISDIHILPNSVIDAVVDYYKSEHMLALFVEDLRSDGYRLRDQTTKSAMYADYVDLLKQSQRLGHLALAPLKTYLAASASPDSGDADA